MLKILIADDHEIVRKGLKQILQEEYLFAYIDEAGNGKILVDKATGEEWDIVIADISMPLMNGIDALYHIKSHSPKQPVLILSMHPEDQYAIIIFKAGASGYLSKEMAQEELANAVRKILSGKKYFSESLASKIAAIPDYDHTHAGLHHLLSKREMSVFKLLASGKSITEISEMLSVGTSTVSTYRFRILQKLNMETNSEIIRHALEHKMI